MLAPTGIFIQNHYREAVQAIQSLETELEVLRAEFQIPDEDFKRYLAAQKKYLSDLREASPTTTLKSQYVRVLNELSQCRCENFIRRILFTNQK
jgi:hypothetical protein